MELSPGTLDSALQYGYARQPAQPDTSRAFSGESMPPSHITPRMVSLVHSRTSAHAAAPLRQGALHELECDLPCFAVGGENKHGLQ